MRDSRPNSLPSAFWRLWTASTISNLGDGVFLVALPLMAARITRSELSIALVAVAALLPWLLFSLPIGAIVDRHDRRTLMVRADLFRFVAVGTVAVVAIVGSLQIWMLWIMAFALGTAEVVFDNSSQAILPAIVEPDQLGVANGRKYSAETAANLFLGTPLGGALFAIAVWVPFGFNALSFLIAAVLVGSLRGDFRTEPVQRSSTITREVRQGLSWLWSHRILRALALALAVSNLGLQMPQGLFVLYAQDELGVSERWFGVLIALMGLGSVIGGLVANRIVQRIGTIFALYSAFIIWALSLLVFAVAPYLWAVTLMSAILAFAITVWNVVSVSLRQEIVPQRLFGRVNSVFRWFAFGSMPIGAAIGGLIGRWLGVRAAYVAGAVCVMAALSILMTSVRPEPLRRARDVAATARALAKDPTPTSLLRDPLFD
jgi:MFS family permease